MIDSMVTATMPKLNQKLIAQAAASSYSELGVAYSKPIHEINYSNNLVRTRKNYYDSKAELPEGMRMSTAGEELAIQLALERAGKDPRKAAVFKDYFGRNNDDWYAWQWTETGLRVPNGYDASKFETDAHGRKYW